MAIIDDLDFERAKNLLQGFGWKIKNQEVKMRILVITMEKDREEPEQDITVTPT